MNKNKILTILFLLLSTTVLYFQYQRLISHEIQQKIFFDTNAQNWTDRDLYFINSISDFYPSLNVFAMPIKALKARYLIEKNEIERAINYLNEASKENPYIMFSEGTLANLYERLGDYEKFGYYARKAIQGVPNNPVHFINYAKFMKLENKLDSVMYYFEKIQGKIQSRDPQIYEIILASLLNDSLSFEKYNAKEIAEEAIEVFPNEVKLKLLTDYIFYTEDGVKLAKEKHDQAVELFPKNNSESVKLFYQAIQLHPSNQQYYDNYIIANHNSRNYQNNSEIFIEYQNRFEEIQVDILFYLAVSLYDQKQDDSACEILRGMDSNEIFAFNRNDFIRCY